MAYNIGYPNSDTGNINPPIEKGSTFVLDFTITDVFAANNPDAILPLLPALTLRGQYRPILLGDTHTDFETPVCTRAVAVPPATTGIVTCKLVLSAATTAAMTAGIGVWDCELEDSTGFVMKPFGCANKAKVIGEVTRSV